MWPNNDVIMGNVRNHLLSIYYRTDVICDMKWKEKRVTALALELRSSRGATHQITFPRERDVRVG